MEREMESEMEGRGVPEGVGREVEVEVVRGREIGAPLAKGVGRGRGPDVGVGQAALSRAVALEGGPVGAAGRGQEGHDEQRHRRNVEQNGPRR